MEPKYSFTIPSIHDHLPLDCRIYHPKILRAVLNDATRVPRAAIVAHPYAPLGGCFDDPVVLAVTETLLREGFVVSTFNFRGAGESAGSTSMTGKAEQADYETFAAFMIYYMQCLHQDDNSTISKPASANDDSDEQEPDAPVVIERSQSQAMDLLLAGYSYGSLVLARLSPVEAILQRLDNAEKNSAVQEILSRSSSLAARSTVAIRAARYSDSSRQAHKAHGKFDHSFVNGDRSMTTSSDGAPQGSTKRHGRRSRGSKGPDNTNRGARPHHSEDAPISDMISCDRDPATLSERQIVPNVRVSYLFISPVVLPFTHSLCPPGSPSNIPFFSRGITPGACQAYLNHPTLAVFGSKDGFTSSHRLRTWAEKQSKISRSAFEWAEIDGAGHFWREDGVMQGLQEKVRSWVRSEAQR